MEKKISRIKLGARGKAPTAHMNNIKRIHGRFLDAQTSNLERFKYFNSEIYAKVCYKKRTQEHTTLIPDIAIYERATDTGITGDLKVIIEVEHKMKFDRAKEKTHYYFDDQIGVEEYFIYLYDSGEWYKMDINQQGKIIKTKSDYSHTIGINLSDLFLSMIEFAMKYQRK